MAVKMLKTFLLASFSFLLLLCFATTFFYGKTLFTNPYPVGYKNITSFWLMKPYLLANRTEAQRTIRQEDINREAPTNGTLDLCPVDPPKLVGPLYVEFDSKLTMEEVENHGSSFLEMGGRFKPPDCIARQKVAIIIPFRNRHEHLKYWLFYLHPVLKRQLLDYGVYVINQDGDGIFNRAKLMNVGYVEALKEYDYDCFVFSDVDLIPLDDRNLYQCLASPRHLAVAMDKFNFHLPYSTYFGGVSSLSKEHVQKINGFPNTYWGWGGEDDDIYNRITLRGMSISRPDTIRGRYKMVKHSRDLHNERNPINAQKIHKTRGTMINDGLNSLKYKVTQIVKTIMFTFITVDIEAPTVMP